MVLAAASAPSPGSPYSRGEEIRYTQKLRRRNRTYSLYPLVLLCILLALLVWAILRANLSPKSTSDFPWKISIVDSGTAANLAGGLTALILARNQFAMSVRPYPGFSIRRRPGHIVLPSGEITILLFNSGQGVARFESVEYSIRVRDCQYDGSDEWLDYNEIRTLLENLGLIEGEHFGLHLLGHGRLAHTDRESALEMLSFRREFLDIIELFDIRIRFSDVVGDHHEVIFGCIRSMPPAYFS